MYTQGDIVQDSEDELYLVELGQGMEFPKSQFQKIGYKIPFESQSSDLENIEAAHYHEEFGWWVEITSVDELTGMVPKDQSSRSR